MTTNTQPVTVVAPAPRPRREKVIPPAPVTPPPLADPTDAYERDGAGELPFTASPVSPPVRPQPRPQPLPPPSLPVTNARAAQDTSIPGVTHYEFHARPELIWAILTAMGTVLAQALIDAQAVTDWRSWALGLASALIRAGLGALLSATKPPAAGGAVAAKGDATMDVRRLR